MQPFSPIVFVSRRRVAVCAALFCVTLVACNKQETTDAVEAQESSVTLTTVEQEPADRRAEPSPSQYEEVYDIPSAQGLVPVDGDAESARIPECETPPDDTGTPPSVVPPANYERQGAPEGTDELARALRVEHAEDFLPIDVFKEDPLSEQRLRYLATHGELMVERQRAIGVLQHFPSEATRLLLLQLAQQEGLHIAVRTQALRSLRVIADDEDQDAQDVLDAARNSEDARMREAAGAPQDNRLDGAKGSPSSP